MIRSRAGNWPQCPEEGVTGHELAASPDGKQAYVPIYGNAGVGHAGTDGSLLRVINLATRQIVGTVDFGKGVRPHCVVVGPKNGLLYVTTELDQSVAVIDPATLKIVGRVPTGSPESHMLAITHDGQRGYTANVSSGTVSILNLVSNKFVSLISVCKTTQRIALSIDDRWIFTADQDSPRLSCHQHLREQCGPSDPLPALAYRHRADAGRPMAGGGSSGSVQKVAVVDLRSMKVAKTIDVPKAPQEVLIRPDGAEAYVSCDSSRKVAVIDTRNWTLTKLINAGAGVDGLAWAP